MYRMSMTLFSIQKSLRCKVCMNLLDDNPLKKEYNQNNIISTFAFNGNRYINVTPKPYLRIEPYKRESEYSVNDSFTLNRRSLFSMISHLKKLLKAFITNEDLFYKVNTYNETAKLIVNQDKIEDAREYVRCSDNKLLCLEPVVIYDENGQAYEGVIMYVNVLDKAFQLTYEESRYLLYELEKVNLQDLSLLMMTLYFNTYGRNATTSNVKKILKVENEYHEECNPEIRQEENKPEIHIEDSVIPKL